MQFQENGGYMEERIMKNHKISLFNRNSGIINGVREVISLIPGRSFWIQNRGC